MCSTLQRRYIRRWSPEIWQIFGRFHTDITRYLIVLFRPYFAGYLSSDTLYHFYLTVTMKALLVLAAVICAASAQFPVFAGNNADKLLAARKFVSLHTCNSNPPPLSFLPISPPHHSPLPQSLLCLHVHLPISLSPHLTLSHSLSLSIQSCIYPLVHQFISSSIISQYSDL